MNTEKYKDRRYLDTIFLIKDILQELGIEVKEYCWEYSKGFFTTMVKVQDIGISTNGKGCSKEQAFASAYGEFMERLQNFAFYKFKHLIPEEIYDNLGFYYAPDEKLIGSFDEMNFNKEINEVINIVMNGQQKELQDKWLEVHTNHEKKHRKFLALPFIKYMTNDSVDFPAKLLVESYGTNGMCAGNSFSEALVQGISEIFERYANKLIYVNKIIPPIIPDEILRTMPEVMYMISELEKEYKIEFRDCSLGLGLPVIAIFAYDNQNGKYYIKFGSHPFLKIAIERCVTELFQGRGNHNKLIWLQDISFDDVSVNKENLMNAYKTGNAQYPFEIFSSSYSYTFQNVFMKEDTTNNKDLLDFLVEVIKRNNKEMLYRDVSFLNFNAYQVVIVGMSEIFYLDDNYVNRLNTFKRVKSTMNDLKNANQERLTEILIWMNNYLNYNSRIGIMTDLKLDNDCIYSTGAKVFEFFIYLKLKRFKDAHRALVEYLTKSNINDKRRAFFKCFKEVLEAREKQITDSQIYEVLGKMYSKDLLDYTLRMIEDTNDYFDKFHSINCQDYSKCTLENKCNTSKVINLHIKLMDKYKSYAS